MFWRIDIGTSHLFRGEIESLSKLTFDTLVVDCHACDWVSASSGFFDSAKKWKLIVFPDDALVHGGSNNRGAHHEKIDHSALKEDSIRFLKEHGYQQIHDIDLRSGKWLGFRLPATG